MATVLLIDDDEGIRRVFSQYLQRKGYDVIAAADGQTALKEASKRRPDVIVTDLIMPEREGIETIRAFRSQPNPPPVIAISGADSASTYLSLAVKFGARRALLKPFHPEELLAAIQEAMGGSSRHFVLLDDEAAERRLHRRLLERAFPGCEIAECSTPHEALDHCRQKNGEIDAILADHHLAGADGIDFVTQIRAAQVGCPILMVTGSSSPDVHRRAEQAGVTKVFSPESGSAVDYLRSTLK